MGDKQTLLQQIFFISLYINKNQDLPTKDDCSTADYGEKRPEGHSRTKLDESCQHSNLRGSDRLSSGR